jgi:hypothetical protein
VDGAQAFVDKEGTFTQQHVQFYTNVKSEKRPTDGPGYRAWDYAPATTVESKSHFPLFKPYKLSWYNILDWPVQVREPFSDPWSKNYKPVGGSAASIELYNRTKDSDQWKKY